MDVSRYTTIQKWSRDLAGVFTIPDLKVALEEDAELTLYRKLTNASLPSTIDSGMNNDRERTGTTGKRTGSHYPEI